MLSVEECNHILLFLCVKVNRLSFKVIISLNLHICSMAVFILSCKTVLCPEIIICCLSCIKDYTLKFLKGQFMQKDSEFILNTILAYIMNVIWVQNNTDPHSCLLYENTHRHLKNILFWELLAYIWVLYVRSVFIVCHFYHSSFLSVLCHSGDSVIRS